MRRPPRRRLRGGRKKRKGSSPYFIPSFEQEEGKKGRLFSSRLSGGEQAELPEGEFPPTGEREKERALTFSAIMEPVEDSRQKGEGGGKTLSLSSREGKGKSPTLSSRRKKGGSREADPTGGEREKRRKFFHCRDGVGGKKNRPTIHFRREKGEKKRTFLSLLSSPKEKTQEAQCGEEGGVEDLFTFYQEKKKGLLLSCGKKGRSE